MMRKSIITKSRGLIERFNWPTDTFNVAIGCCITLVLSQITACITSNLPRIESVDGDSSKSNLGMHHDSERDLRVIDKPVGEGNCKFRPELGACCDGMESDCQKCRQKVRALLDNWKDECLPNFPQLQDCSPGIRITECCGDEREECKDCLAKTFELVIEWRHLCGSNQVDDCKSGPKKLNCCESQEPTCLFCRERQQKLIKSWNLRCGSSEKSL